ncbi:uncharacterized protein MONBRDRAFT_10710 [Monosiga brevicollis MX1]|uniref:E2 ubiquitin-conjugating enzyme n=1 Tax=Monosiga brevicollis TaxID=81824 RepID=A9V705_MONBE|nr:uncharacterized protein MONBRDRAFT_10710 [Monosiga brevicollis MX1]EDQ86706.1 predicted protein [Monosiga brevicollis MX1]|eukprot:XP_001748542.1 hypothetical protein [Monosiga brevicollis MX1]
MAIRRLQKELRACLAAADDGLHVAPREDNLLEWHFCFAGETGTCYEGGLYWGRLVFPPRYPAQAPDIFILTPNGALPRSCTRAFAHPGRPGAVSPRSLLLSAPSGRFETSKALCLQGTTGYHNETWSPATTVLSLLLSLRVAMTDDGVGGIGSLRASRSERSALALSSTSYNARHPDFQSSFPSLCPPSSSPSSSLLPVSPHTSGSQDASDDAAPCAKEGGLAGAAPGGPSCELPARDPAPGVLTPVSNFAPAAARESLLVEKFRDGIHFFTTRTLSPLEAQLHSAATNGHVGEIRRLVYRGVDLCAADAHGRNAVSKAGSNRVIEGLFLLIEAGVPHLHHGPILAYRRHHIGSLHPLKHLLEEIAFHADPASTSMSNEAFEQRRRELRHLLASRLERPCDPKPLPPLWPNACASRLIKQLITTLRDPNIEPQCCLAALCALADHSLTSARRAAVVLQHDALPLILSQMRRFTNRLDICYHAVLTIYETLLKVKDVSTPGLLNTAAQFDSMLLCATLALANALSLGLALRTSGTMPSVASIESKEQYERLAHDLAHLASRLITELALVEPTLLIQRLQLAEQQLQLQPDQNLHPDEVCTGHLVRFVIAAIRHFASPEIDRMAFWFLLCLLRQPALPEHHCSWTQLAHSVASERRVHSPKAEEVWVLLHTAAASSSGASIQPSATPADPPCMSAAPAAVSASGNSPPESPPCSKHATGSPTPKDFDKHVAASAPSIVNSRHSSPSPAAQDVQSFKSELAPVAHLQPSPSNNPLAPAAAHSAKVPIPAQREPPEAADHPQPGRLEAQNLGAEEMSTTQDWLRELAWDPQSDIRQAACRGKASVVASAWSGAVEVATKVGKRAMLYDLLRDLVLPDHDGKHSCAAAGSSGNVAICDTLITLAERGLAFKYHALPPRYGRHHVEALNRHHAHLERLAELAGLLCDDEARPGLAGPRAALRQERDTLIDELRANFSPPKANPTVLEYLQQQSVAGDLATLRRLVPSSTHGKICPCCTDPLLTLSEARDATSLALPVVRLPCGHYQHLLCVQDWSLGNRATCPDCDRALPHAWGPRPLPPQCSPDLLGLRLLLAMLADEMSFPAIVAIACRQLADQMLTSSRRAMEMLEEDGLAVVFAAAVMHPHQAAVMYHAAYCAYELVLRAKEPSVRRRLGTRGVVTHLVGIALLAIANSVGSEPKPPLWCDVAEMATRLVTEVTIHFGEQVLAIFVSSRPDDNPIVQALVGADGSQAIKAFGSLLARYRGEQRVERFAFWFFLVLMRASAGTPLPSSWLRTMYLTAEARRQEEKKANDVVTLLRRLYPSEMLRAIERDEGPVDEALATVSLWRQLHPRNMLGNTNGRRSLQPVQLAIRLNAALVMGYARLLDVDTALDAREVEHHRAALEELHMPDRHGRPLISAALRRLERQMPAQAADAVAVMLQRGAPLAWFEPAPRAGVIRPASLAPLTPLVDVFLYQRRDVRSTHDANSAGGPHSNEATITHGRGSQAGPEDIRTAASDLVLPTFAPAQLMGALRNWTLDSQSNVPRTMATLDLAGFVNATRAENAVNAVLSAAARRDGASSIFAEAPWTLSRHSCDAVTGLNLAEPATAGPRAAPGSAGLASLVEDHDVMLSRARAPGQGSCSLYGRRSSVQATTMATSSAALSAGPSSQNLQRYSMDLQLASTPSHGVGDEQVDLAASTDSNHDADAEEARCPSQAMMGESQAGSEADAGSDDDAELLGAQAPHATSWAGDGEDESPDEGVMTPPGYQKMLDEDHAHFVTAVRDHLGLARRESDSSPSLPPPPAIHGRFLRLGVDELLERQRHWLGSWDLGVLEESAQNGTMAHGKEAGIMTYHCRALANQVSVSRAAQSVPFCRWFFKSFAAGLAVAVNAGELSVSLLVVIYLAEGLETLGRCAVLFRTAAAVQFEAALVLKALLLSLDGTWPTLAHTVRELLMLLVCIRDNAGEYLQEQSKHAYWWPVHTLCDESLRLLQHAAMINPAVCDMIEQLLARPDDLVASQPPQSPPQAHSVTPNATASGHNPESSAASPSALTRTCHSANMATEPDEVEAPEQTQAPVEDATEETQSHVATAAAGESALQQTDLQALPARTYLDRTVVPVLLEGMAVLAKERPPNPVEFLAAFLIKNKDHPQTNADPGPGCPPSSAAGTNGDCLCPPATECTAPDIAACQFDVDGSAYFSAANCPDCTCEATPAIHRILSPTYGTRCFQSAECRLTWSSSTLVTTVHIKLGLQDEAMVVPPTIDVVYTPIKDEQLYRGQSYTIAYQASNSVTRVNIFLYQAEADNYARLHYVTHVAIDTPNTGTYTWLVPISPTECTPCPLGHHTAERGAQSTADCRANATTSLDQFRRYAHHYIAGANAGGVRMDTVDHVTPEECAKLCLADAGCKSFDAGVVGQFQEGDCMLSYDSKDTTSPGAFQPISQLDHYERVSFAGTVRQAASGLEIQGQFGTEGGKFSLTRACQAEENPDKPFVVDDVWLGSMSCTPATTNETMSLASVERLELLVTAVAGTEVQFTVDFDSSGGVGLFAAAAVYDATAPCRGLAIQPKPDAWISRPTDAVAAFQLSATLSTGGDRLTGQISLNKHCACLGGASGIGGHCDYWAGSAERWCYVSESCPEAEPEAPTAGDEQLRYRRVCRAQDACGAFELQRTCASTSLSCQPGYTLFAGHCYRYDNESRSFASAQAACASEDAVLASVHSAAENEAVTALAEAPAWLGLHRVDAESLYHWVDGADNKTDGLLTDTFWARGSPSSGTPGARCVYLNAVGFWVDAECSVARGAICEAPAVGLNQSCACRGHSDDQGFGASCQDWDGSGFAWCYVQPGCRRATQLDDHEDWILICRAEETEPVEPNPNSTACFAQNSSTYQRDDGVCAPCTTADACLRNETLIGSCSKDTSPICFPCHPSCRTCTGISSTDCVACATGLVFAPDQGTCVTTCAMGQYPNATLASCLPCHEDCVSCSGAGPDQCLSCRNDLVLSTAGTCMDHCAAGTFTENATATCRVCTPCAATEYQVEACGAYHDRQCAAVSTCAPDEFEVIAPTATSDAVCRTLSICRPGTVMAFPGNKTSDRRCVSCPAGTSDEDADPLTACSLCAPGTYARAGTISDCNMCMPGSSDDDYDPATPCAACPPGTYSNAQYHVGACLTLTPCGVGQQEILAPDAARTRDRLCASCPAGTFKSSPNQNVSCQTWTTCTAGEEPQNVPTARTNRQCGACRAGFFKTTAGNEACQPFQTCGLGMEIARNGSASQNVACRECPVGTFNDHVGGSCRKRRTCALPWQRYAFMGSSSADAVCVELRNCSRNEFESVAATSSTDRRCQTLTACGANEWEESAPAEGPHGFYVRDRHCLACTNCSQLATEQLAACTATHDAANEYEVSPCRQSADRSATGDRVCASVSTCPTGTFEVEPATNFSDRMYARFTFEQFFPVCFVTVEEAPFPAFKSTVTCVFEAALL